MCVRDYAQISIAPWIQMYVSGAISSYRRLRLFHVDAAADAATTDADAVTVFRNTFMALAWIIREFPI